MSSNDTTKNLLRLLDEERLVSFERVQVALREFSEELSEEHIEPLLGDLVSSAFPGTRPILALLLSGEFFFSDLGEMSSILLSHAFHSPAGSCSDTLSTWIVDHFPTSSADGFASSVSFSILTKLSLFMLFAHPFERETAQKLSAYRIQVELAPKALDALASAVFSPESETLDVDNDEWGFIKPKRTSQRQRKGAKQKAARAAVSFDSKSFKALGLSVPQCPEESEILSLRIMGDQKAILKVDGFALHPLYMDLTDL